MAMCAALDEQAMHWEIHLGGRGPTVEQRAALHWDIHLWGRGPKVASGELHTFTYGAFACFVPWYWYGCSLRWIDTCTVQALRQMCTWKSEGPAFSSVPTQDRFEKKNPILEPWWCRRLSTGNRHTAVQAGRDLKNRHCTAALAAQARCMADHHRLRD